MSIADLVKGKIAPSSQAKSRPSAPATATPATIATMQASKGGIVAIVAGVAVATPQTDKIDQPDSGPYRLWDVQDGDGKWWSVSTTPSATRRDLARSWPDALRIEPAPEDDTDP